MTEDVSWPKASEGGKIVKKEQVGAYWSREWGEFDPHVEPLAITKGAGGKVHVRVHQLVKNLQGDVLSDSEVLHVLTVKKGLIAASSLCTPPVVEIRSLAPDDDATAFLTLNEEWITRYFTLEAKDRETLNDPINFILMNGGHIFTAYAGAEAVGCVALIPTRDGIHELSKMAVSPHLRGGSLGRRLLQHAVAQGQKPRRQVSVPRQ